VYKYSVLKAVILSIICVLGIGGLMLILMFAIPEGDDGDLAVSMITMVINISTTFTTIQKIVFFDK